jgi:hypothetical protein
MSYWKITISEAADECGIKLTEEQIDFLATAIEGAHENFSLYTGRDCIPNPLKTELDDTKTMFKKEQERMEKVCDRKVKEWREEYRLMCRKYDDLCDIYSSFRRRCKCQ